MRSTLNKLIDMKFNTSIMRSLAIFAVMLTVLSGCQKKVLELQPYSSFSDASAFADAAKVNLAVNGVYDAAQSGFYAGGAVRGYPFGAASVQQGDMRGEDMHNTALFYQITYEATYTNVSANNDFQFQTLYALINKANLVKEGVEGAVAKGIVPSSTGLQFVAECRFLRALAHHELVTNWARPYADGNGSKEGVIYREFGINSEAKADEARALKRADFTVATVYSKILADLDYAENNLPATTSIRTYRASKAAAIALKMRVKLHMNDWPGVIAEGNKIISTSAPFTSSIGAWALTATPDGAFANNQSTESIFSIKNDATDNAGANGGLANMAGDPNLNGRGIIRISPIIWSDPRWICTDLRRGATMVRDYSTAKYTFKYRDIANNSDGAPMIRYAEVLLTQAEAEARNASGVSSRAVDLLNAVRNRAVTTPADQFTVASFANKDALIAAILFERRVEFLGEGKRWSDIHRLALDPVHAPVTGGGIPSKVVTTSAVPASLFNCAGVTAPGVPRGIASIPYADNRFLWPVSLVEIQQNPNYTQNPGY
jgi:hypothetical protein